MENDSTKKNLSDFKKPVGWMIYGSKEWANEILKIGIKECKNIGRVGWARYYEILYYIRLLNNNGFWWQSRCLRFWMHRYWDLLQPKVDSPKGSKGGES